MQRSIFLLAFSLACGSAFAAPAPAPVRAEIDGLLGRLQASGCQFSRNGTWYSGADAKKHLLRKLAYFEDKGTVQNTEQFITLAASKSSASGKAYQVKCAGTAPVDSQAWLTKELGVIRSTAR